jgi:hypothetical protein
MGVARPDATRHAGIAALVSAGYDAPVVLLLLLGAVLVLAGAFYLVYQLSVNGFASLVERRQRDAEFVLFTGRIPPSWLPRRVSSSPGRRSARRRARRRLRRLVSYYRHTPLVPSEKERESMLRRLREIREDWKKAEWDQIVLP